MRKKHAGILIVDDQDEILFSARLVLKKSFENVFTANSPRKIIEILGAEQIDVVLLDMNYRIGYEDGREGIHWLKEIKSLSPATMVILMTAFGKIETAVEGLKQGAFDYVLKPWDNAKLLETVNLAVDESRRKQNKSAAESSGEKRIFAGQSPKIRQAYAIAEKVARTDANVLITGENGTGKFVFAHFIHQNSARRDKPFVHVDLGSLSESLFESELFGYARGAFTDAKADTPGRFEAANGGTIFLDEIGNIPLHLQSKLLSAIQSKTITRLGESKPRAVDVRIITATNIDIRAEVRLKNFREDLFYRINTMEIQLPPLRERREDIVPMAEFLLGEIGHRYGNPGFTLEATNREFLERYPWHGNVRELENKLERAVILSDSDVISIASLDIAGYDLIEESTAPELSGLEKSAIERSLLKNAGNISKTADELGLSRAALYRRIEKYEIKIPAS